MKAVEKAFVSLFLLMMVISSASAADTIRINYTYKHGLDKEGHSLGYVTIRQKFYTPEQQLFRMINYDEHSGQLTDYTFYFYSEGRLLTEECYNVNDSLVYILKHGYDAAGRENEVIRLEPGSGGLKGIMKTVSTYDKAGKLHQQKIYYGKKVGSISSFVYNPDGNLKSESHTYKPVSSNNLKSENRTYSYNTGKNPVKVEITGNDINGKSIQRSETYSYDEKGNVSSVKISANDLPEGLVKTYTYLPSGLINLYEESNTAGLYTMILQYEYEKRYMDRGTQVSYLAGRK